MKYKVLISGKLHPQAIQAFQNNPKMLVEYRPDCPAQEVAEIISDYHVLVSRSETDIDRTLLEKALNLKVIGRAAVGVGNIDIEYATQKGILVINCPGKNTNSAAEMTMALLLSMFRKVPQAYQTLKSGGWDRHRFSGFELRGKKIGIVGLGNVGHRVAMMARGFDMEVFAYDPYIAPKVFERYQAKQVHQLADLAACVDIMSFHVPLNDETKGMADLTILEKMHAGSYVLNAARGGVIVEADLLTALQSGHIAGAGVDTWEAEPRPNPALLKHENVYCTPHIGASTEEAQLAIGSTIYEQVHKAMSGSVVDYPVNLPEVGTIDHPILKSYAILAEKLGSLAAQILEFNPQDVRLYYRGSLADFDQTLIKLAFLKGYLTHAVDDYVSYVNVLQHAEKKGLTLFEEKDPGFTAYSSALKVQVSSGSNKLQIGGTVFDSSAIRLSLINDYHFELEPNGTFVLIENLDRVGVVGKVGTFFANESINIDSFYLSRNKKGGTAMSLVRVDNALTQTQVKQLCSIENIVSAKLVLL
ncbi:MAG: phosphoglycerate dehydrogenase [Oligoflexales bacterium]|nr:phosphoglycerate dehydrogenase [Oligoflexales bacterium]